MSEKLLTAAEFEEAFNLAKTEDPGMIPSLVLTAVLTALKKEEENERRLKLLAARLMQVGIIPTPGKQAPRSQAPQSQAATTAGEPRKGANGEPLTPQEAAIEDMMDTAEVDNSQPVVPPVAGQGPAQPRRQHAQTPQQQSAQVVEGGAPPAPVADGNTRIGMDGRPLSPQEEAIERMMDSAVPE